MPAASPSPVPASSSVWRRVAASEIQATGACVHAQSRGVCSTALLPVQPALQEHAPSRTHLWQLQSLPTEARKLDVQLALRSCELVREALKSERGGGGSGTGDCPHCPVQPLVDTQLADEEAVVWGATAVPLTRCKARAKEEKAYLLALGRGGRGRAVCSVFRERHSADAQLQRCLRLQALLLR